MASNVGNQIVTLIYHAPANVEEINRRELGIRSTGIYQGGYLKVVDGSHFQLTPLVCEITDGDYQVRIQMQDAVTKTISSASPYVVLRWAHQMVQADDYMDILTTSSPQANDLIVGKGLFSGGTLINFSYDERSIPKDPQLYLKVEETGDNELRVRIRGGYIQNSSGSIFIPDQKSNLITPPTTLKKIYLVWVDPETGAISIDSSGVEDANPVAPDYQGRTVLAEITVASTDTEITNQMITDVRSFLRNPGPLVDNTTIQFNTSNALELKAIPSGMVDSSNIGAIFGEWTNKDSLNNTLEINNVYKSTSDGFVVFYGRTGEDGWIKIETDASNPPTTMVAMAQPESEGSGQSTLTVPIKKNHYWKATGNPTSKSIYWLPIGNGQCVKM